MERGSKLTKQQRIRVANDNKTELWVNQVLYKIMMFHKGTTILTFLDKMEPSRPGWMPKGI
jgi:hypothetical protein